MKNNSGFIAMINLPREEEMLPYCRCNHPQARAYRFPSASMTSERKEPEVPTIAD
jgi:hypothetical protein